MICLLTVSVLKCANQHLKNCPQLKNKLRTCYGIPMVRTLNENGGTEPYWMSFDEFVLNATEKQWHGPSPPPTTTIGPMTTKATTTTTTTQASKTTPNIKPEVFQNTIPGCVYSIECPAESNAFVHCVQFKLMDVENEDKAYPGYGGGFGGGSAEGYARSRDRD